MKWIGHNHIHIHTCRRAGQVVKTLISNLKGAWLKPYMGPLVLYPLEVENVSLSTVLRYHLA